MNSNIARGYKMAFESVFKTREFVYQCRITKKNMLHLRYSEIEDIKKFTFVHVKIDKSKKLIGLILEEKNPEGKFYRIAQKGDDSIINLKPAFKELGVKLTNKFYIKEIIKDQGMYIIDLSDAK
jgi:hypothetical protein